MADLVDKLPSGSAVPECFEACAVFVRTEADDSDMKQASGPASSTVAGEQEEETRDAEELVKWMSVVDEDDTDIGQMTSLPSLQRMLDRMESQAGRVAANELLAAVGNAGSGDIDELGRSRLAKISREFHALCQKKSTWRGICATAMARASAGDELRGSTAGA